MQEELRQVYAPKSGSRSSVQQLPEKMLGSNRCFACIDRRYKCCDRQLVEDQICTFCRRNGYPCAANPWHRIGVDIFAVGKISQRVESEGADYNPELPEAPIKELPPHLRVKSELLDGIFRAASWHAAVYKQNQGDGAEADVYGCLDNHCLLSLGILAQELIREQLRQYLMPVESGRTTRNIEAKLQDGELRREITHRQPQYQKWIEMLTVPPTPPYLQREQSAGTAADQKEGSDGEGASGEEGANDRGSPSTDDAAGLTE